MRKQIPRGLIVSCQAGKGEPLYGCDLMHYFARCAVAGGAVAIRALADEIPSIRHEVKVPIIGLIKKDYPDSEVYITPTKAEIDVLLKTGCEVIAMDATARPRPNGETLAEIVSYVRSVNDEVALMADIDDYDDAVMADKLGFDYISTTLRGFTRETKGLRVPDCGFVKKLKEACRAKIIVEGGIWEKKQLEDISAFNPYAVVAGTSITRPKDITKRFVESLRLQ